MIKKTGISENATGSPCLRSGKKLSRTLQLLFFIILAFSVVPDVWSEQNTVDKSNPRILVLHSYHFGFTWSENVSRGIRSVLTRLSPETEIVTEFMDVKRLSSEEYLMSLSALYHQKYKSQKIDVIISADDHALQFLLGKAKDLLPGIPAVFCGINNYNPRMFEGAERPFTGIVEDIDIKGTLDLALSLHGPVTEVAYVTDTTVTGMALKESAEKVFESYQDRLQFLYLEHTSMEKLQREVSALPSTAIVFAFIFTHDEYERIWSHEYNLQRLASVCSVPIYSVWEFYLGYGIIGGLLTSGEMHGEEAAHMAYRIIEGENAADIPVITQSPNRYGFDYTYMKKFGFKKNDLPEGSIIINKPFSLYESYKGLVWGTIIAFFVLVVLISLLVASNVTRQKSQKALKKSEHQFRAFMERIPGLAYIKDKNGRIVYANGGFRSYLNIDPQGIINKKNEDVFPPDFASRISADDRNVMKSKTYKEIEESFGGRIWTTHKFIIHQDEKDLLLGGITLDITQRKKAEQRLATERERLAVTLRSIGDGVITTDVKGRIVLVNRAAEQLTGWRQKEALGLPLTDVFKIINEITREPCDNPVEKVLSSGNMVELANHTVLISKDGTERIIADSGAPIKDRESVTIGVVLVFRDMTDKHRIHEIIQRTAKLDSLAVLAGGIAHDFNNLLGGIYGYLDIAQTHAGNPIVSEYLEKSVSTIDRARGLTMQLLTFAKGGAPSRKSDSLFPFVEETTRFALSGSNVTFQCDVEDNLWTCFFDKNQIGQVIDNIIINAQQAMPLGGKINIIAKNVLYEAGGHPILAKGKYVRLSIQDSGTGIPAEFISRIFDPFFTTKTKGHGLGLATCYSIITRHEGHIEVESEQGEGTIFTIYLPVSSAGSIKREKGKTGSHSGKGTILVMDDEEVMREAMSAMLKTLGYSVVCKNNGKEALDFFNQEKNSGRKITAIIVDLTIRGGMGGKEVVTEIRKSDPDIPVFVASGYAENPVLANPVEFGFSDSIKKPFLKSELIEMLNRHLH